MKKKSNPKRKRLAIPNDSDGQCLLTTPTMTPPTMEVSLSSSRQTKAFQMQPMSQMLCM
jgi:hypothetical protein